jgi:hypothetical protein
MVVVVIVVTVTVVFVIVVVEVVTVVVAVEISSGLILSYKTIFVCLGQDITNNFVSVQP